MEWIKTSQNSKISTHTLRGERDFTLIIDYVQKTISTHTLRGERDLTTPCPLSSLHIFQLTRSVGSVTPSK